MAGHRATDRPVAGAALDELYILVRLALVAAKAMGGSGCYGVSAGAGVSRGPRFSARIAAYNAGSADRASTRAHHAGGRGRAPGAITDGADRAGEQRIEGARGYFERAAAR